MSVEMTPDMLHNCVCEYALDLLEIPVSERSLPVEFSRILPENDYLEPPLSWAVVLSKALKVSSMDSPRVSDFASFKELLVGTLASLGTPRRPPEIVDPYYLVMIRGWSDSNPGWELREAKYRLHLRRSELRHPDFGDKIRGVRVEDSSKDYRGDIIQGFIDRFYEENPESLDADTKILKIIGGMALNLKRSPKSSLG